MKYEKKTKPALWTTVPAARKRLEAAALLRQVAKASISFVKRGKAAAKAAKRRLERSRQPRKRIRPVSQRKAAERAAYVAKRDEFLAANHVCRGCAQPAKTELHHLRGRLGPLLNDDRFWVALCPKCHRWVHDNINAARERNLIAQPGDWNNPR